MLCWGMVEEITRILIRHIVLGMVKEMIIINKKAYVLQYCIEFELWWVKSEKYWCVGMVKKIK